MRTHSNWQSIFSWFHDEPWNLWNNIGMRKTTCSKCDREKELTRAGQRYCLACHAAHMRATRPVYRELSALVMSKVKARGRARCLHTRQPCAHCNDPNTERHHPDYSKPLEIVWLCRSCHLLLHSSQNEE